MELLEIPIHTNGQSSSTTGSFNSQALTNSSNKNPQFLTPLALQDFLNQSLSYTSTLPNTQLLL